MEGVKNLFQLFKSKDPDNAVLAATTIGFSDISGLINNSPFCNEHILMNGGRIYTFFKETKNKLRMIEIVYWHGILKHYYVFNKITEKGESFGFLDDSSSYKTNDEFYKLLKEIKNLVDGKI